MNEYTETEILLIESIPEEDEELHPTNLSQYLSRLAFVLIVLGSIFFIPSSTVEAQGLSLTFYNETSNPISVAYKYYSANCRCWETSGWQRIPPGSTGGFGGGNQSTLFFYAIDPYTGRRWGATNHYSFVMNPAFRVNERYIQSSNSTQLQSQGYYEVPFARVDAVAAGYSPVYYLR
jgi:uncharacterized membrane protein